MWSNRGHWSRLFNNRTAPITSDSLSVDEIQRVIPPTFVLIHHQKQAANTSRKKMDPDDMEFVQIVPFQNYDSLRVSTAPKQLRIQ